MRITWDEQVFRNINMIINYLIHHYKLALALHCHSVSRLSQHVRNTGVSGKVVYLGTTLYHSIESVQRCCTNILFEF